MVKAQFNLKRSASFDDLWPKLNVCFFEPLYFHYYVEPQYPVRSTRVGQIRHTYLGHWQLPRLHCTRLSTKLRVHAGMSGKLANGYTFIIHENALFVIQKILSEIDTQRTKKLVFTLKDRKYQKYEYSNFISLPAQPQHTISRSQRNESYSGCWWILKGFFLFILIFWVYKNLFFSK